MNVLLRQFGKPRCKACSCVRGAMLLEVVVSLGLLVFGLAMVGAQIRSSLEVAYNDDIQTRAILLADTKISELTAGGVEIESYDDEYKGYFGIAYPGYTWRITIEPTETDDFYMATLEIGYNAGLVDQQIDLPEMELDFEDVGTKIVRTVYRLFPSPAVMDLERDFGVSQEVIDEIAGELPIPGIDLNNLDPRMLANLPSEILEELLPMLDVFLKSGGDVSSLKNLLSEFDLDALSGASGASDASDGDESKDGEAEEAEDEERSGRFRSGSRR